MKYLRAFAVAYPGRELVQAPRAQITWYHHTTLLDKVRDSTERLWYAGNSAIYPSRAAFRAAARRRDSFHRFISSCVRNFCARNFGRGGPGGSAATVGWRAHSRTFA